MKQQNLLNPTKSVFEWCPEIMQETKNPEINKYSGKCW